MQGPKPDVSSAAQQEQLARRGLDPRTPTPIAVMAMMAGRVVGGNAPRANLAIARRSDETASRRASSRMVLRLIVDATTKDVALAAWASAVEAAATDGTTHAQSASSWSSTQQSES